MHKKPIFFATLLLVLMLFPACLQDLSFYDVPGSPFDLALGSVAEETIVDGFKVPYGLAIVEEGEYFISDRSGKFFHFRDEELIEIDGLPDTKTFRDPRFVVLLHGGLMDISLRPDYATTP